VSLHDRNALGHVTRATFYGNLQEKCPSPEPRRTLCANLRSQNASQHFTRATLHGNLQGKCSGPGSAQNADTHFVRACAVKMHFNISQEPLYTEIYRKNARAQSEDPDQAPAFAPTVRTPQCGHSMDIYQYIYINPRCSMYGIFTYKTG